MFSITDVYLYSIFLYSVLFISNWCSILPCYSLLHFAFNNLFRSTLLFCFILFIHSCVLILFSPVIFPLLFSCYAVFSSARCSDFLPALFSVPFCLFHSILFCLLYSILFYSLILFCSQTVQDNQVYFMSYELDYMSVFSLVCCNISALFPITLHGVSSNAWCEV